jgi:hypothetical protein
MLNSLMSACFRRSSGLKNKSAVVPFRFERPQDQPKSLHEISEVIGVDENKGILPCR